MTIDFVPVIYLILSASGPITRDFPKLVASSIKVMLLGDCNNILYTMICSCLS
jgi:hypothetical protein